MELTTACLGSGLLIGLFLIILLMKNSWVRTQFPYFYSCVLKSIGSAKDAQSRLEAFYCDQINVYDETRHTILRGRKTMLKLCAAQLQCQKQSGGQGQDKNKNEMRGKIPLVWVDIGGGTGWNIEQMNSFFSIKNFDAIYLIDLTPSMCSAAKERFTRLGWEDRVKVICADGSNFQFPPSVEGVVSLMTMSYSLSMMDNFFQVVDRVRNLLHPELGIVGVADFYVSSRISRSDALNRQCNWLTRWFWQIYFNFDYIELHPSRRDYLEHCFQSIKEYNTRNHFIIPYLSQIPYYVWLGKSKGQNMQNSSSSWVRLPYDSTLPIHSQFSNYIFAFNWEDPREDLKALNLSTKDKILTITSAGDNILNYMCSLSQDAPIQEIHCVDINPTQNHLLELKLAAINAIPYEDFWKMFGLGHHSKFQAILDQKLSPWLSSSAYQFWKHNATNFKGNFYKTGSSGIALRIVQMLIQIFRLRKAADELCSAESLEEQKRIYDSSFRRWLIGSRWLINLFGNATFLWMAHGIPMNQIRMILEQGTYHEYTYNSFEQVMDSFLLRNDQYFYRLCLQLQYSKECCPEYLTEEGFARLKSCHYSEGSLKIHTNSVLNVLLGLDDNSLTKVVLMDHLDWFNEVEAAEEIAALKQKVAKGGIIIWRSVSRVPWYNKLFIQNGFQVEAIGVREPRIGKALDRVNTYASFYRAIKI